MARVSSICSISTLSMRLRFEEMFQKLPFKPGSFLPGEGEWICFFIFFATKDDGFFRSRDLFDDASSCFLSRSLSMALTSLLGRPGRVPSVSQKRPLRPVDDEGAVPSFLLFFFNFFNVLSICFDLSQSFVVVVVVAVPVLEALESLVLDLFLVRLEDFLLTMSGAATEISVDEGAIGIASAASIFAASTEDVSLPMRREREMLS